MSMRDLGGEGREGRGGMGGWQIQCRANLFSSSAARVRRRAQPCFAALPPPRLRLHVPCGANCAAATRVCSLKSAAS
jgi:hypothetical protein